MIHLFKERLGLFKKLNQSQSRQRNLSPVILAEDSPWPHVRLSTRHMLIVSEPMAYTLRRILDILYSATRRGVCRGLHTGTPPVHNHLTPSRQSVHLYTVFVFSPRFKRHTFFCFCLVFFWRTSCSLYWYQVLHRIMYRETLVGLNGKTNAFMPCWGWGVL